MTSRFSQHDSKTPQLTDVMQLPASRHRTTFHRGREAEHTYPVAEHAISKIKAFSLPADPPSFEIFYHYMGAFNPMLNQTINETIERKGLLSIDDLDQIYDAYFSSTRTRDAIDRISQKLDSEINEIAVTIKAAVDSATVSRYRYADIEQQLNKPIDTDALRKVVEGLLLATKTAEEENGALQTKLRASQHQIETLQLNLTSIRRESVTDPLTQVANRKGFAEALKEGISKAHQDSKPLSLLLADIDHFKTFNDTHGHLVGDSVLRLVGMLLKRAVTGQGTVARYGGEEFAIILPNTSLFDAKVAAEKFRTAIMTKELKKQSTGESLGQVTISIGVAQLAFNDVTETLIERADKCLYAAKRNGRNQVVCEEDMNWNEVEP